MKRTYRVVFFLFPLVLQSQQVKMEIPDTRKILKGKLSIVFKDTVSEEQARVFIRQLGYSIAESKYKPVTVFAGADDSLSTEAVNKLKTHPAFLSVQYRDMMSILEWIKQRLRERDSVFAMTFPDSSASLPRFSVLVIFASTASEESVRKLVGEVRELKNPRFHKSINEIVINVPEDKEEQAAARAQKSGLVEFVSYIIAQ